MSAECVRIECALQDDPRLTAAIPLLISHSARLAGIAETVSKAFANEAAELCRKVLSGLAQTEEDPAIQLLIDQFQDRVEVTLEYSGSQPLVPRGAAQPAVGDSVQQESVDGKSRMKFTKFCGTVHPRHSK